jgi:hypothetical protein
MPAGPLGSLTPCNLVIAKRSNHVDTARQIFETMPADPGCAPEARLGCPGVVLTASEKSANITRSPVLVLILAG